MTHTSENKLLIKNLLGSEGLIKDRSPSPSHMGSYDDENYLYFNFFIYKYTFNLLYTEV